jgi:hypothetical protein
MSHNQYPETVRVLGPKIELVKEQLRARRPPSEIATFLHAQGLHELHLMIIFHEATGASLKDLKALGQWWGQRGVTDPQAFDAYAMEVFQKLGALR